MEPHVVPFLVDDFQGFHLGVFSGVTFTFLAKHIGFLEPNSVFFCGLKFQVFCVFKIRNYGPSNIALDLVYEDHKNKSSHSNKLPGYVP